MTQRSAREARIQLISEGVIASYIHDISTQDLAPGHWVPGVAVSSFSGALRPVPERARRPAREPRRGEVADAVVEAA
jgi:hypothetical protein